MWRENEVAVQGLTAVQSCLASEAVIRGIQSVDNAQGERSGIEGRFKRATEGKEGGHKQRSVRQRRGSLRSDESG